jgi:hypothetical protein
VPLPRAMLSGRLRRNRRQQSRQQVRTAKLALVHPHLQDCQEVVEGFLQVDMKLLTRSCGCGAQWLLIGLPYHALMFVLLACHACHVQRVLMCARRKTMQPPGLRPPGCLQLSTLTEC